MSIITPMVQPMVRPMVTAMGEGGQRSPEQIIQSLFAQGQQGFWLPFTDFASLSQDSAGTLPYTALEQPVGRVLDRSGRGNHASQVTSTARGVVSALVNRLVNTDNPAAWEFSGTRFSAGAKTGGGWPLTALVTNSQLVGVNTVYPIGSTTINQYATLVRCIEAKAGTATHLYFGGGYSLGAVVRLTDGVVEYIASGMTADVTSIGGGYYRITVRISGSTFSTTVLGNVIGWGLGQTSGSISPAGQVGTTVFVRNPDYGLYPLAFTGAVRHQRVNTSTDYDSVGFPKYAKVDGVDDNYTCGGGGSTTGFYYSDVIRPNGAGNRTLLYNGAFSLKSGVIISLSSNKFNVAIGNGSAYVPLLSAQTLTNGELVHVAAWDDLTNVYLQINGGTIQSMARPAMLAGPPTINLYNTGAFEHYNGQITEPIYRAGPPPNAYEREVIRNYQMQKAGML